MGGSWSLWEELAKKAPDFGRTNTFCGNVDESKWESFTLTMHSDTLIKRWVEYTGNELGTGAMTTLVDSGWYLSAVVVGQPHFAHQPEGTYTMWGWGLEIDNEGDYVKKKMSQATGTEILTELIHQFGVEDIIEEVLATTDVTPSMLPDAPALFARAGPGDGPRALHDGAEKVAGLGPLAALTGAGRCAAETRVDAGVQTGRPRGGATPPPNPSGARAGSFRSSALRGT